MKARKKYRRGKTAITLDDIDLDGTHSSRRAKKNEKKRRKSKKSSGGLDGPDFDTDDDEESDDSTDFPKQRARQLCILDPNVGWRFYFDIIVMFLMFYVLYVTPFELSFVQSTPRFGALWLINVLVDLGFVFEIVIGLNTAFFDRKRHAWILSRHKIFRRYAKVWLWVDILALVRWELVIRAIFGGGASGAQYRYLRLIRLAKLIRLVRLLKAPELMSRIAQHFTLSHKSKLVVRAVLLLLSLLHFEACVIRASHDIIRHERRNLDITTYLSTSFRLYRSKFKQGNFAIYMDSLDWAVQTLLGQSMFTNTTEAVLSIFNNLLGLLIVSFLIGEVANVLCNLDPARNEFHQTSDMLNNYMREHNFPAALRWKLHLYLSHSEDLFRSRFHDALVQRLSPPLQELVAHFMLGKRVLQAPFFGYARQVTFGLVAGRRVWIKPPRRRGGWRRRLSSASFQQSTTSSNDDTSSETGSTSADSIISDASSSDCKKIASFASSPYTTKKVVKLNGDDNNDDDETDNIMLVDNEDDEHGVRYAKIIMLRPHMRYDVRYEDDDVIEYDLPHTRISLESEPVEVQRSIQSMNHMTKLIVTDFARAMKMNLYNGGDYICRKNVSRSNRLWIVDQGTILAFGIDIAKPFGVTNLREGGCFGAGEMARISAGHNSLLSWYNARASEMTRLLMLKAEDFLDIISTPGYEDFHKCVTRYGRWINLKICVCTALRNGTLKEELQEGFKSMDDPAKRKLTKLDEAKKQQALMVGAASTHFERLLSSKLADHSVHVEELVRELSTEHSARDALRMNEVDQLRDKLVSLESKLDSDILTKLDALTSAVQQLSRGSVNAAHSPTSSQLPANPQHQEDRHPSSTTLASRLFASTPAGTMPSPRSSSSLRQFVVG